MYMVLRCGPKIDIGDNKQEGAPCIHLISSSNLGIMINQFSDNVRVTSASSPRQARHVMLHRHGNSSSSNNNNMDYIRDTTSKMNFTYTYCN